MTFTLYISGQKGLAALQGMEQESAGLDLVVIGRDPHITADHSEEIINYCEAKGYTYTLDKDTTNHTLHSHCDNGGPTGILPYRGIPQ